MCQGALWEEIQIKNRIRNLRPAAARLCLKTKYAEEKRREDMKDWKF